MYGTYKASNGLTFAFGDGGVDISGCGSMVQGGHTITIQPSGSTLLLKIANQPQALQMTLGADGKLTGPAAQDITGQKITSYEVVTNLKTGASTRNPIYGPDTEHCNIGTLLPGPATEPDQGFIADLSGVLSILSGSVSDNSSTHPLRSSPGPRMAGTFASAGGLKIQFSDGGAIIDCAQAHVPAKYSVAISAGSIRATVQNGSFPVHLDAGGKRSFEWRRDYHFKWKVDDRTRQQQRPDPHANKRELPCGHHDGSKVKPFLSVLFAETSKRKNKKGCDARFSYWPMPSDLAWYVTIFFSVRTGHWREPRGR